MKKPPIPTDEAQRLAALQVYGILDTPPEQDFDDFTRIASQVCGTPISLISLVDEARQWFKAKVGLEATETPRDLAFCAHVILQHEVMVVPDSSLDQRFHDNPLVTGAPFVRFYAGAPLETPSGQRIGTLCVIDHQPRQLTSEQIAALQALARQIINLLELRLRTTALAAATGELQRSRDEAVSQAEKSLSATNAKSSFLANMSHEIRTPLNGILGSASLLQDTPLNAEQTVLVRTINNSGSILLALVNDILDLSKIEAGKLDIEQQPFSIREAVADGLKMIGLHASEKGLALRSQFTERVPAIIETDPVRFRQILLNLLSNAVKFTAAGAVSVSVDYKPAATPAQGILLVAVEDSGIGIELKDIEKLFRNFSQADASTTRRFGGTGLGLAICKELCHLLGGSISVTSTPGVGSCFAFQIAVRPCTKASASQETSAAMNALLCRAYPLKILVAEDNDVNQMIVASFLKRLGYQAQIVANGAEALSAVQAVRFDLVFMDLQMPVMDGCTATVRIRSDLPAEQQPYIIALTASVTKEEQDQCLAAGMQDFLKKPLNSRELVRVLERFLASRQTARSA